MHNPVTSVLVAAFLVQALTPFPGVVAQTREPEPATFLRKQLEFTPSDLATLESGQIIVKLPKTPETREVAAFTIARLDVPSDFLVDRVRDIATFKKGDSVLQIGKFSNPPRLGDLDGLTVDQVDIDAIKRCRVNNCDLKMSATSIEKLRKDVNWSEQNYRDQVTRFFRGMLLEHVQAYLKLGNAGLGNYEDKSYKLGLGDEMRTLLKPTSYMYGYLPEFQRYLEGFPTTRQSTAGNFEDFLYWSKEDYGLKPVISMTHVTIQRHAHGTAVDTMIASQGIYASHYLEASLGLTALVQSQASEPPRSYLIYVNRSHTDAFRGFFAGVKRSLVTGRIRDTAKKKMGMIKEKLETEYQE
jgi:hypothetical protein